MSPQTPAVDARVEHDTYGPGTVLQADGPWLMIQFDGQVCPGVGIHAEDVTLPTEASVRIQAADIIEPHVTGDFKRRDRAEGIAADLHYAGLLLGGRGSKGLPNVQEHTANHLQCRMSWPTAEKVAAELAAAGLLNT